MTAVYRFETKIDSANADLEGGRLSYVGLSGGFGTVTVGQVWSASYNHFGAIVDQGHKYTDPETTFRTANTISYAVDVGSVSFQADVSGNPGGGWSETARAAAAADEPKAAAEDKDIDASQFGATLALGENAKVALSHINYDARKKQSKKHTAVAGACTIGGMTMFLGYGQQKIKDDGAFTASEATGTAAKPKRVATDRKDKTTFLGVHGGLGDTGVNFVMVARSKKASGKERVDALGGGVAADFAAAADIDEEKTTPWVIGLSRGLGGGASVILEHSNVDDDSKKNTTGLFLAVNF